MMQKPAPNTGSGIQGILSIDKPRGQTSFSLVAMLRRRLGVKKIGHAGTLDPFATGVMVMLIGRDYTRLSDQFITDDKEYVAEIRFGIATDSHDCDGEVTSRSDLIPTAEQVTACLESFQGTVMQTPPMFSAKKVNGKKLYELARKGQTIEREPVQVTMETHLLSYEYPYLNVRVRCSKGTYIRTIAHDIGTMLGCGAHVLNLQRTRSGKFRIEESINYDHVVDSKTDVAALLVRQ